MSVLEDIGFYCIDNMPPQLIEKFADICLHSKRKLERVAIAVDIRSGDRFDDIINSMKALRKPEWISRSYILRLIMRFC